MFSKLQTFIVSSIVLLSIDLTYLSLISNFFKNQIQVVQHSSLEINYIGAIISYIFILIGLNYFILYRKNTTLLDAFILGLCVYGVFEGTNYALFKKWSLTTVVMDTLWGGILYSLTTYITRKLV